MGLRPPEAIAVELRGSTVGSIGFLPPVKAYPALSRRYGEVSCIAGVQMLSGGPRWIRLYPGPFRALEDRQQFAKHQPTRVRVESHSRH